MDKKILAIRLEILKRFQRQGDFAVAVGCCDSLVSTVLHGRRKLTDEQGKRWLEVLRCGRKVLAPILK